MSDGGFTQCPDRVMSVSSRESESPCRIDLSTPGFFTPLDGAIGVFLIGQGPAPQARKAREVLLNGFLMGGLQN